MMAWSTTQPARGMLVALDNSAWDIITAIYDEGEYPGDHRFIAIDTSDPAHGEYDGSYTPLAPAPTPGGLWAAICMGGCIGGDFSVMESTYWKAETGRLIFRRRAGGIRSFFNPDEPRVDDIDYEAHMRDMQKYGALLAYCAQPGWQE